jgi:hypothetical protein
MELTREMLVGLLAGGFIVLLAFFWPDGSRNKNRLRNEAARHALAALHGGRESPWSVVCRYLRERLDFPAVEPTPREVARFLKRRGFALERCAQSEAFLQACDAVQFTGGSAVAAKSLAEEAATLIESLEADPCVR